MINTTFKKIINDLLENRGRSILTILAIILGIMGAGSVFFSYTILMREMDKNYMKTDPMSATLSVENLDSVIVNKIKERSDIKEVTVRGFYRGRFGDGENSWKGLWLFIVEDFENQKLNTFYPENGAWPPAKGEILIERAALNVAKVRMGDTREIIIPGNNKVSLTISGVVHDPGEPPAWMENLVYGYITRETLEMLGETSLNELNIQVVPEYYFDYDKVKKITRSVKAELEEAGYEVSSSFAPEPGKHPHASQMESLLFLLFIFGILALFLSSVLVINLIQAMLAGQIRQIGIMKSLGARSSQIFRMYTIKVLLMGAAGLIPGLFLSVLLARGYSENAAAMLNFVIFDDSIPLTSYLIVILTGLSVPFISSIVPILKGTGITAREAMSDYGIKNEGSEKVSFLFIRKILGSLSRPLLLSIQNTFKKKGRIILTLGTLAIGGAMFITSLNIGEGIKATIDEFASIVTYDISITLKDPVPVDILKDIAEQTEGTADYEAWQQTEGYIRYADGKIGNSFEIFAVPGDSKLFAPKITGGSWLGEEEMGVMVVRHTFFSQYPDLKTDQTVTVMIDGQPVKLRIKGVSRFIGPARAYISPKQFAAIKGEENSAKALMVRGAQKKQVFVEKLSQGLEKEFARQNIPVAYNINIGEYRKVLEDHFLIIVTYLLIMSVLIILVGGLGLAVTMSIQVIERTREIGVMRAIGAAGKNIISIIISEGLFIGLLSYLLSLIVSLPVTYFVGNSFGSIFFGAPLTFALNFGGIGVWFGVIALFSLAASLVPSLLAVKLPVSKTLAYE